jgi:hypothetical protein
MTDISLPYEHLNLCRNPFGKMTREEKNHLVVLRMDLNPFIERLKKPGYAIQFLKEGARNKTTHLLVMWRHFPDSPYIRLFEGEPAPAIPNAPVLFIDWMHVLSRRERAELLQRPASFGIVSHQNHGREFKQASLDYDLVKLPKYSIPKMMEQVDQRILWARRDPNKPIPRVTEATLSKLMAENHDEMAVLARLYDLFEELTGVEDV